MSKSESIRVLPKATAVWLIENTSLTFKQIADFCGIHELEVKGIADGEVASGIAGVDPIFVTCQLTKEEIERCTNNPNAKLVARHSIGDDIINRSKKKTKYTPIARRHDKPDAIYWLLKNYPDIQDSQIVKLIGTTKSTIETVRNRTHWNMANIRARDPVLLGICTQIEIEKLLPSNSVKVQNIENQEDKTQ